MGNITTDTTPGWCNVTIDLQNIENDQILSIFVYFLKRLFETAVQDWRQSEVEGFSSAQIQQLRCATTWWLCSGLDGSHEDGRDIWQFDFQMSRLAGSVCNQEFASEQVSDNVFDCLWRLLYFGRVFGWKSKIKACVDCTL
jgi:hypothetical protein